VPDHASLQEADVARQRDPPFSRRRVRHVRIVGQQQGVETGKTQQRGEFPQVDVEHETYG
jgi:hypothetical protein